MLPSRNRYEAIMRAEIPIASAFLGLFAPLGVAGDWTISVVPIEIVNNFPVIEVSIGNQQIPVAFDLGGDTQIELTNEALQKIQVEPLNKTYVWFDAKGHRLEAPMFRIPELRIGNHVFKDVEGHEDAEAADWPKTRAGLGRMGRNLLTQYLIELNYPAKTFGILDSAARNTAGDHCTGRRVEFDPKWEGDAVTPVLTDYGTLTFVWDTGAPGIFVQSSLLNRGKTTKTSKEPVLSQQFVIDGKNFGPLALRPISFSEPAGIDGFLGSSFFDHNVVCVDYPGHAIFVR
jgi:hypothetical protein